MSDAVSALAGASYDGFVRVKEMGLCGMITLRGDLALAGVQKAVKAAVGTDMPGQRQIVSNGDKAVAWMSPDELLLMVPHGEVEDVIAGLQKALKGVHFLAVNVSDARAVFRISGADVRDVIAKLVPVDLSAAGFGTGDFRRTRMAQVPAAFWMPDGDSVQIVCFRSVATYVFGLLKDAAEAGGEVGFHG